jgi:superfamily II DNA helicase RecQ
MPGSPSALVTSENGSSSPISSLSSPAGQALAREILRPILGFDPHDYQLEGTCKILDGVDLLAVIPTSGGKTGFFFMPILLRKAIREDTRFSSEIRDRIQAEGTMVVVLPTIAVELEMVRATLVVHSRYHSLLS